MCESERPTLRLSQNYGIIKGGECMQLVTRGHFRSRDKDGGHTVRFPIVENPMLHTPNGSIFYRTVLGDRSLQCGNRDSGHIGGAKMNVLC